MLIEFSVENFRSFREKQVFSMVAAPRLRRKDNVFQPEADGERLPPLLKVAAIYGPNASGKSNLIDAMGLVRKIIKISPSAFVRPLPISSFRFDPMLEALPSRFELHFVHSRCRYSFELAVTKDRITEEILTIYPKGQEKLLYKRKYINGHDDYQFGDYLEGGSDVHQAWRKLTGPQALFITQAVANSNEELKQLGKPLEWLTDGLSLAGTNLNTYVNAVQKLLIEFPALSDSIVKLLRDVDVPITHLSAKKLDQSIEIENNNQIPTEESIDKLPPWLSEKNKVRTTLTHTTALGSAEFDFSEESEGTKNVIGFSIPWLVLQNKSTTYRKTLVVDELDSSLHPKIVEALLEKHITSDTPSQLIFTTHDTHLMDTKLLRRDQFWIAERDQNGATQMRSIHDFEGRESEDIEKRYYEGRYRGLPLVRRGKA